MRINNYISSSGYSSRRGADRLIEEKKVRVNGSLVGLGYQVEEGDRVEVEGRLIRPRKDQVYLALNKPPGITSTTERHVEGNIVDFVGYPERIFPIGRLDKDSQGLILLTSDGSVVNKILREENKNSKEYIVTVDKNMDSNFLDSMARGVRIFNPVKKRYVTTKKCQVTRLGKRSFRIVLLQGLNRQIRRMCGALGYEVVDLKRVRIMDIHLGDLPLGRWRYLTKKELEVIRRL